MVTFLVHYFSFLYHFSFLILDIGDFQLQSALAFISRVSFWFPLIFLYRLWLPDAFCYRAFGRWHMISRGFLAIDFTAQDAARYFLRCAYFWYWLMPLYFRDITRQVIFFREMPDSLPTAADFHLVCHAFGHYHTQYYQSNGNTTPLTYTAAAYTPPFWSQPASEYAYRHTKFTHLLSFLSYAPLYLPRYLLVAGIIISLPRRAYTTGLRCLFDLCLRFLDIWWWADEFLRFLHYRIAILLERRVADAYLLHSRYFILLYYFYCRRALLHILALANGLRHFSPYWLLMTFRRHSPRCLIRYHIFIITKTPAITQCRLHAAALSPLSPAAPLTIFIDTRIFAFIDMLSR